MTVVQKLFILGRAKRLVQEARFDFALAPAVRGWIDLARRTANKNGELALVRALQRLEDGILN